MTTNHIFGARDAQVVSAPETYDTRVARGFYCGTSGNVTFTMEDGSSIQFVDIAAGVIHPIRFTGISAMTATDALAIF